MFSDNSNISHVSSIHNTSIAQNADPSTFDPLSILCRLRGTELSEMSVASHAPSIASSGSPTQSTSTRPSLPKYTDLSTTSIPPRPPREVAAPPPSSIPPRSVARVSAHKPSSAPPVPTVIPTSSSPTTMAALLSQKSTLPLATPPQLQAYVSGLESKVSALTLKLESTKGELESCRKELAETKQSNQTSIRKKDASLSQLRSRYAELRTRCEDAEAKLAEKMEREKKETERKNYKLAARGGRLTNGKARDNTVTANGKMLNKIKNQTSKYATTRRGSAPVVEVDLMSMEAPDRGTVVEAKFH
eukprot:CAMPEP_0118643904 /NCGR_PEP_ID=MMETSP0785-20121206/6639_1 /TAXON_ID=91992 /ORGANISM="Bolidomonas pacifica, Strain CCMP 1866" /LENGTH=302 /DNA_ID=CAMNT_0006535597 /DNA_START=47 /DNA_END=952 /DNA_ORIENTATION=-